eukprot:759946-Pelagomonas_calceolata.AAC.2
MSLYFTILMCRVIQVRQRIHMHRWSHVPYAGQGDLVNHSSLLLTRSLLISLHAAVIHARPPRDNSTKAHEQILARMLEYVATAAGIEAALTDDIAREEVRLAMESVFSFSALARFYTLSEEDRAQQPLIHCLSNICTSTNDGPHCPTCSDILTRCRPALQWCCQTCLPCLICFSLAWLQMQELARITLGICLFNREVGRGGYALPPGTSTYMPQQVGVDCKANRLLRDIGRHVAELSTEVQGCAAVQRISSSRPKAQSGKTEVEDEKNRAQVRSLV